MLEQWNKILQRPDYWDFSPEDRAKIKGRWFDKYVVPHADFQAFSPEEQKTLTDRFNEPEDYVGYDRGIVSDIISRAARGGLRLVESVGGALRMIDLDPTKNTGLLGRAGKAVTDVTARAEQKYDIFKPDIAEARGEEGFLKRGVGGAIESIAPSLAPLGGVIAGGAIGTAILPGIGTAVGGAIGGLVTLFATFGLGNYQTTYDETIELLKRKGETGEEAEQKARKNALISATAEAGGELVGDLAAMTFFGVLGRRAISQSLKGTIRGLMGGGKKEFAKSLAKVIPFETGSEIGTAYFQAKSAQDTGISDVSPGEAMAEAILPAIILSTIFGGAVHGMQSVRARQLYSNLNSEDPGQRVAAVQEIAGRMKDAEDRQTWLDTASAFIQTGEPIPISKPIVDFAIQKTDQEAAPEIERQAKKEQADLVLQEINAAETADEAVAAFQRGADKRTAPSAKSPLAATGLSAELTAAEDIIGPEEGGLGPGLLARGQELQQTFRIQEDRFFNRIANETEKYGAELPDETITALRSEGAQMGLSPERVNQAIIDGISGKRPPGPLAEPLAAGLLASRMAPKPVVEAAPAAKLPVIEEEPIIEAEVTPEKPVEVPQMPEIKAEAVTEKEIDIEANEAATSPLNDLPEPSQAQMEAGNYKKGHVSIQGMEIAIENPKGSERSGVDASGKPWSVTLQNHYGYFNRTEGRDGDQIDVIIGPDTESQQAFIVDQVNPETGEFDEHKTLIGFSDKVAAQKAYLSNYETGWQGLGAITEMPMDEFKEWIGDGTRKTEPVGTLIQPEKETALAAEVKKVKAKAAAKKAEAKTEAEVEKPGPEEGTSAWVLYQYGGFVNQPDTAQAQDAMLELSRRGLIESLEVTDEDMFIAKTTDGVTHRFSMADSFPEEVENFKKLLKVKEVPDAEGITPEIEAAGPEEGAGREEDEAARIRDLKQARATERRKKETRGELEKPITLEPSEDRVTGAPEDLGNLGRALSALPEGKEIGRGDIDSFTRGVLRDVSALIAEGPEIAGLVIKGIPVDVMDNLILEQPPSEVGLDNKDVLKGLSSVSLDVPITRAQRGVVLAMLTALKQPGTGLGAKISGTPYLGWATQEGFTAKLTDEIDKIHKFDSTPSRKISQEEKPLTPMAKEVKKLKEKKAPEKPAAVPEKQIVDLRDGADKLQKQIDEKRHPATADLPTTRRRAAQVSSSMAEADRLEATQSAMRGLADALEAGTAPGIVRLLKTKTVIEDVLLLTDWSRVEPTVRQADIKETFDLMKGVKGAPALRKELQSAIRRGTTRPGGWMVLLSSQEVESASKLISLAKKSGKYETYGPTSNLADNLSSAKRMTKAGIETEAQFTEAKEYLEGLVKGPTPEQVKADKLRELEAGLIGVPLPGFFPTPKPIIDHMLDLAEIDPGDDILEPSAGKGDIADAVIEKYPENKIYLVERSNTLVEVLEAKGYAVEDRDFLEYEAEAGYEKIIMNPPFEKGQDMDHVRHAYTLLKPGGRIVSIMSEGSFSRTDKKATEFREWLDEVGGVDEKLEPGAFKGAESFRQTGVAARVVTIDKLAEVPAAAEPPTFKEGDQVQPTAASDFSREIYTGKVLQITSKGQIMIEDTGMGYLPASDFELVKATAEGPAAFVGEFKKATTESMAELRDEISNVKYGPIEGVRGTIEFDFRGKKYSAPEVDFVLGTSESADASIALRTLLDKTAKEVTPLKEPKYTPTAGPTPITLTREDVQRIFKGQRVLEADDGVVIQTTGKQYLQIKDVEQIAPDEIVFRATWGKEYSGRGISGKYQDGVITLSRTKRGVNKYVLRHEQVHWLEDTGILSKTDISLLSSHIKKLSKSGAWKTKTPDNIGGEEDRAWWISNQLEGVPGTQPKIIERIMNKVREWIDRLVNIFDRTAGGIVREIETGAIYEAAGDQEGMFDRPRFAPAPPPDSKAFKDWFGDSKVVDESGDPLVVYHGSGQTDIEVFDIEKAGTIQTNDWGKGIYFTPSPAGADYYREEALVSEGVDPEGDRLYKEYEEEAKRLGTRPMYEAIDLGFDTPKYKQLKEYTDRWLEHRKRTREGVGGEVYPVYIKMENPYVYQYVGITDPYLPEIAIGKGHDGIIIVNEPVKGHLSNYIDEIIVFNPEQIKSVYNIGTYDPQDPRIRYTPADDIDPIISEVFDTHEKSTIATAIRGVLSPDNITGVKAKEHISDLRTKTLDRLHPIEQLGRKPYILYRMLGNAHIVISTFLQHGNLSWKDQALTVETKDKGFLPWLEKLGTDGRKLFYWIAVKRAETLGREGRENWLTEDRREEVLDSIFKGLSDDARTAKEAKFEKLNKEFQKWNQNILDIAKESGLLNDEQIDSWERDFYLPFYRLMEDESTREDFLKGPMKSKQHISAQIRRLKGGEEKLGDPVENILRNWSHLIQESQRNMAWIEAKNAAVPMGLAEIVPKSELIKILGSQTKKQWGVKKTGADRASRLFDFEYEAKLYLDKLESKRRPKDPPYEIVERKTTQVMFGRKEDFQITSGQVNGETEYIRVADPDLFEAMAEVNTTPFDSTIMKIFGASKRILTMGATIGPAFRVANLLRDTLHTAVVSPGFTPFIDSMRGVIKVWNKSPEYIAVMASGSGFGKGWVDSGDPKAQTRAIDRIVKAEGQKARNWVLDTPRKIWDFWDRVGHASEMAARVQKYSNVMAGGGIHLEAAFEARDLLDFHRTGAANSVRVLVATVPFLNARIQGMDRMYRGAKDNKVAFFTKGALVASASLMLWGLFKDDDRYKELEDWDKWQYHHFWIGSQHFRLPKAFEVGAIFSSLFETAANVIDGQEGGKFFLAFLAHSLTQTFALSPPTAVAPLIEVFANKSFFTGRPIENLSMQRLPMGERARPWTPEILKALGRGQNVISPVRMETLIRGYTATFGTTFTTLVDAMYRLATDAPDRPAMRIQDMPGIGRFVRADVAGTKYATRYYEFARDVEELVGTLRNYKAAGEYDKAREMTKRLRNKLRFKSFLNATNRRLSVIRKKEKLVWLSRTMDPKEKRRRLDGLQVQKNDVYLKAYQRMNK